VAQEKKPCMELLSRLWFVRVENVDFMMWLFLLFVFIKLYQYFVF